jgi:hypothetical protein
MRFFRTVLSILFLTTAYSMQSVALADDLKPEMYFDLGNVIVDTRDWANVHYIPGAKEYLADLTAKGYGTHMIVNFVDKLGPETYHNCEEKFVGMVKFLRSKWHDTIPFEWTQFQSLILPPTDQQRKPRPNMFVNALASSCPAPVLYQGEDDKEIQTAKFLGLGYWQTALANGIGVIPEVEIKDQIAKTSRFSYPEDCQLFIPERCELSAADMARLIEAIPVEPAPADPVPAFLGNRKEF